MFQCNYAKLRLSFNEFHDIEEKIVPEYDEFCLLELKDGGYTAGKWMPDDYLEKEKMAGKFVRGTADAISLDEISKWHSLARYDLSNCLVDEKVNYINLGEEGEGIYSVKMKDFKSISDGDFPKEEQYCLLILTNGRLAGGRWNQWSEKNSGCFIYAPALSSYRMDEVWAWTPLSTDEFFAIQEEIENEKKREEELNRDPSIDQDKFKYGLDIEVYYKKALEKLRKEYPWASKAQMKKREPWKIVPHHGRYVFGQVDDAFKDSISVEEWTEGSTADEFIDFLCEYTRETVKNSNPDIKFKYGTDIEPYLEKAYENVKKDYRWIDKELVEKYCRHAIKKVNGDWEFVRKYKGNRKYYVCDYNSADRFIESVEDDYQSAALRANPAVARYSVPFERIELFGWYLERYEFLKLKTGDYKVYVQAGDRTTGGSREFFITPYCFEAETYEEFLDRYLEIVPGRSFGLYKEDLLSNEKLKSFLGY